MMLPLRLFSAAAGLLWLFLLTVPAPWLRAANPVITVKCEPVSDPGFDANTLYNGNTVTPTVNKHCETGNWFVTWPSPGAPQLYPGVYVMRTYKDGVPVTDPPPPPIYYFGTWSWELRQYGSGDTVGTAPFTITYPAANGKPNAYMVGVFRWNHPCDGTEQPPSEAPNTLTLESPTLSGCTTDTDPGQGQGLPGDIVIGSGRVGGAVTEPGGEWWKARFGDQCADDGPDEGHANIGGDIEDLIVSFWEG